MREAPEETLQKAVGSWAESLRRLSFGIDERAVNPNQERKSIGCEETYAKDLEDLPPIRAEVERLARRTASVLERKELFARTVVLKLRYASFRTITRSQTRAPATRSPDEIVERALALLEKTDAGRTPVRLLGVSAHGLVATREDEDAPAAPRDQFDLPVE